MTNPTTNNKIILAMSDSYNLGDALSHELYMKLSEQKIQREKLSYTESPAYITTGSILRMCKANHHVMGTGFISANDDLGKGDWQGFTNKIHTQPASIISVRGKLTRKKLLAMGVDCPKCYGDPAILTPIAFPFIKEERKSHYDIGLIAHYIDQKDVNYISFKKNLSKKYRTQEINILTGNNFQLFLEKLQQSDTIITSSLHGMILGLVYGKRTILTEFSNNVFGERFKFHDFFSSLEIDYEIFDSKNKALLNNNIHIQNKALLNIGSDMIRNTSFTINTRKKQLLINWQKHINSLQKS